MAYLQDLIELIQLNLPKIELRFLELTNSAWSLNCGFWRTKFISNYCVSLPIGVDYEVEYEIITPKPYNVDETHDQIHEISYRSLRYCVYKGYNEMVYKNNPSFLCRHYLLKEAIKCRNSDITKFLLSEGWEVYDLSPRSQEYVDSMAI